MLLYKKLLLMTFGTTLVYMLSRLIQFVVAECTRVSLLNRSTCQCNRTRYLCSNQRKETIRLEVFTTFVDFNSTDNNT